MATQRRHSLSASEGVKARRHEASSVLAEENAELERKLRQLREAMQKEMHKRDEVRRALTTGGIWGSARPGPLQQITRDVSGPLPASAGPKKAGSWSAYTASGFKTSSMPDYRIGVGPRRPPAKLPPLSPKRASESGAGETERPGAPRRTFDPAAQYSEARDRPGSTSARNGEPGGSLLDGDFDEERNQASFLEAVRAWRNGGEESAGCRGKREEEGEAANMSARRPQSARPASPAVCMEVQTEQPAARPATARPRTARPRTYFEKLAERQAGHLASQAVRRSQQPERVEAVTPTKDL
ncbi:hypothetical protein KFL_002640150 [Klebsormidium nitens]|uniref:Uncharacterized protein n=1 Tax=Klebsormidium nitens TaxID=105231 RepID=A0A0U9HKA9_KLENI|nr:hypothetical protein KFL_002640150 [Klebsormidium nitens]|eukprot:GAQ85994.1 hypothetical protein KFL_002640150 [Klebsormidium nitens]